MHFFDTHFHYYGEQSSEEYYEQAKAADVTYLLAAGANYEESLKAQQFAEAIPTSWFSAGVHPHSAAEYSGEITEFAKFAADPKMVAVGEIGLDYFYENSERQIQLKVFEQFLQLALELKLPAIVHCRDKDNSNSAYEQAYSLLADFAADSGAFVVHCFTGTTDWAEKFLQLGAYLGITGIVTFPKASNVREVLNIIPDKRLLLETDTPYLAPVPHRGRKNHSAYLRNIAEFVADEKKQPLEQIAELTTTNAMRLFRIKSQIPNQSSS